MGNIKNGNLKYKLGIIFIALSFISPLITLIIPFFKLPTEIAVTVGGLFLIGLPEIFFILGAILVGKKAAELLSQKIKEWFFQKKK
ncbi:MAG: transporter suffix domain-containing protein [Legionellaceae bacterium]|nr:transporter suffix domain-containing protein [Legionellaceae bacterium]